MSKSNEIGWAELLGLLLKKLAKLMSKVLAFIGYVICSGLEILIRELAKTFKNATFGKKE